MRLGTMAVPCSVPAKVRGVSVMMGGFRTGIDIGSTHVRAVVLKRHGQSWRWQAGIEVPCQDVEGNQRDLAELLQEVKRKLPQRGPVQLVDSTLTTMVRFIEHPPVAPDRLERGMRMELVQHADEFGNLAADYQTVPVESEDLMVCCALAQPAQVDAVVSLCARNGLTVSQVGLSTAAAANAWAHFEWAIGTKLMTLDELDADTDIDTDIDIDTESKDEFDAEAIEMVLEIGAVASRVVLLRGGKFLACRSLAMGGHRFTQELAVQRGLSPQTAEALKCSGQAAESIVEQLRTQYERQESGIFIDDSASFDQVDTTVPQRYLETADEDERQQFVVTEDSGEFLDEDDALAVEGDQQEEALVPPPGQDTIQLGDQELGPELRPVADQLHMQVQSSINWFRAQLKQRQLPIGRIVLLGAGANLVGLPDYLAKRFRLPVLVPGNEAFGEVGKRVPIGLLPYVAAIGAALPRSQQAMAVDLRSVEYQRKQLLLTYGRLPYIAAGFILAGAIVLGISNWLGTSADAQSLQVYKKHEQAYKKQEKRLQGLQTDSTALQEDLRAIASRIFSGRDLLSTIRVLKQNAPKELWITELRTEGLTSGSEDEPEASTTNTIDRGSLYLEGRVKPQEEGVPVRVNLFEQWSEQIASWQPRPGSPTLFSGKKVLSVREEIEGETEGAVTTSTGGEFSFAIRFDFMPTQIEEVVQTVDRGER